MHRQQLTSGWLPFDGWPLRRRTRVYSVQTWPPEIRRVKGVRCIGVRLGNWLTSDQSRRLLATADRNSLRGKRNYAILAILIGCGLRRSELLALRFDSFELREGRWIVANSMGKAGHMRTVPIPVWVKSAMDEWKEASGIAEGQLFRSINKWAKCGAMA